MRADMNAIRCISDDREELFSLQMKAANLYARYENTNVDVSHLELRPDANRGQIAKREREREDLWSQRESSTSRSARLLIRSRLRTSRTPTERSRVMTSAIVGAVSFALSALIAPMLANADPGYTVLKYDR